MYVGLALYDTFQYIQSPIQTLCLGQAMSMGSLLLAAGAKGKRYILPNATVMIHQPSGGYSGVAEDIAIHAKEILRLRRRLNEIYMKHLTKPHTLAEIGTPRITLDLVFQSFSPSYFSSCFKDYSPSYFSRDSETISHPFYWGIYYRLLSRYVLYFREIPILMPIHFQLAKSYSMQLSRARVDGRKIDGEGLLFGCATGVGDGIGG